MDAGPITLPRPAPPSPQGSSLAWCLVPAHRPATAPARGAPSSVAGRQPGARTGRTNPDWPEWHAEYMVPRAERRRTA
jgi:hypothetical protein